MISATEFCTGYSSSWRLLTPFMDMFVRQVNRGIYDRWDPPVVNHCPPDLRSFQSELAYALVETHWEKYGGFGTHISEVDELSISRARERLARNRSPLLIDGLDVHSVDPPTTLEIAGRARRRLRFFQNVSFQTPLPGCGIISAAITDIIADDHLIEIKNVERGFRATDVRQVLLYSALKYAATGRAFRYLEIANFSQGQVFNMPTEELASSVSGQNPAILFQGILDAVANVYASG